MNYLPLITQKCIVMLFYDPIILIVLHYIINAMYGKTNNQAIVISVQKFTANLYCYCLSTPQILT